MNKYKIDNQEIFGYKRESIFWEVLSVIVILGLSVLAVGITIYYKPILDTIQ